MNRENNKYINETGEVLNATEMRNFVVNEAKRQYKECTGDKFEDMTIDEQSECILSQFEHQLNNRGWTAIQENKTLVKINETKETGRIMKVEKYGGFWIDDDSTTREYSRDEFQLL